MRSFIKKMVPGFAVSLLAGPLAMRSMAEQEITLPPPATPVIAKSSTTAPSTLPPSFDASTALPPATTPRPVAPVSATVPSAVPTKADLAPRMVGQPTAVPLASAPLTIQKTGPTTLFQGVPAEYVVVVRNQGQTPLQDIQVEDELPRGAKLLRTEPQAKDDQGKLTWKIDRMERGEERRFKVQIEPREKGDIQGRTTASFAVSSTMQSKVLSLEASIEVQGPETLTVGSSGKFEIQIANSGAAPLTNLVVRYELGEGMEHSEGRQIEANLGTLAPGDKRQLPLHLKASAKGMCRNRIVVRSGTKQVAEHVQEVRIEEAVAPARHDEVSYTPPPTPVTPPPTPVVPPTTPVVPPAVSTPPASPTPPMSPLSPVTPPSPMTPMSAIKLDLTAGDDPAEVGVERVYLIHVTNCGEGSAMGLKVCAMLPEGVSFVAVEAPVRCRDEGHELQFSPLAELPGKSEVTYRVRVRAQKPGESTFRVYASCDKVDKQACLERNVRILEPKFPSDH
jgi:uncharacterized repeat protein (TIGR01451 family)